MSLLQPSKQKKVLALIPARRGSKGPPPQEMLLPLVDIRQSISPFMPPPGYEQLGGLMEIENMNSQYLMEINYNRDTP